MTKETKDRILQNARDRFQVSQLARHGYIAGAEAEAERAQGLAEALKKVIDMAYQAGNAHIENVAIEALAKYNNPK